MAKLEIVKMLVLSTAHVSKETADKLPRGPSDMESPDDIEDWWPAFTREEGWLWHVGEENPVVTREFPDEFAALFSLAMENGCQWLMLDRDGDTVENLPTFDW